MSAFKELMDKQVASITESHFKTFLPLLLSTEKVTDWSPWLAISVDSRLGVNVVDDNTKEIIFMVPPLQYTPNTLTGKRVASRIKEWMLHNEVSPLHGRAYANKNITEDLVVGVIPPADKETWTMIINRYGYSKSASESIGTVTDLLLGDDDDW